MLKSLWMILTTAILVVPGISKEISKPREDESEEGLHLVLALDCSDSVTPERWRAQVRGYAEAFKSKEILETIVKTPEKAIIVTVVVWSGPREQAHTIRWTRVNGQTSALAFALAIGETPMMYRGYTYIGDAIDFSRKLLRKADATGSRKVIDISGDGRQRDSLFPKDPRSYSLEKARAEAVADGITINGLPIEGKEYEIAKYYQDEVIAGEGAFAEVVKDPDDIGVFAETIKRKLLKEILLSAR